MDMMKAVESAVMSPALSSVSEASRPVATDLHVVDNPVIAEMEAITPKQVEQAVEKINHFFNKTDYGLNFSVDSETGKQMIKVTDRESGDVIRQLPSEAMLKLSRAVGDLQGMLLKEVV